MSQDTVPLATRLSQDPALYHIKALCDDAHIETILALIQDEGWLAAHHISTERTEHGSAWELPVTAHPVLGTIAQRALEAASLGGVGELDSLRLRRTIVGQGHPGHLDDYEVEGQRLVATVLLTLEQPQAGGHTRFERALPQPQHLRPAPKDALLWYNVRRDLSPSWRSWHDGEEVLEGVKTTLGCFIYADPLALAPMEQRLVEASPQRLYIINDVEGSELTQQLYEAALAQDVSPVILHADDFDHVGWSPLEPGSMLYTVGTSHGAHVIEQLLVHEGVATFYADAWGPNLIWDNQSMVLAKAGLPTPRTFYTLTTDKDALKARVEALGGLPIILKVPGRSLGVGVMKLERWATLLSVVDAIYSAHGEYVSMMSCVEPATHWRVIVVGEQAAASYINVVREDDFRTSVDEERAEHFEQAPPAQVIKLAIQACQVLGLEFGGVDVLVHEHTGRAYVLEVNFPCYFGHPMRAVGQDVAAQMVQYLKAKATRALVP